MTGDGAGVAGPSGKGAALHRLLIDQGFFDEDHYLACNPELAGQDLLHHYLTIGHAQGRWPNPQFDPTAYLAANPDVAEGRGEPLSHYAQHGRAENRLLRLEERDALVPTSFDPEYYRDAYGVAAQDGLRHYLGTGFRLGWRPNPAFDPRAYLVTRPDLAASGLEPLLETLRRGSAQDVVHLATPARFPTARRVVEQAVLGRAFLRRHAISVAQGASGAVEGLGAASRELAGRSVPLCDGAGPPDASIIIANAAEPGPLLNCLDALAGHRSRFRAEIIVCGDQPLLHAIPWIRCIPGGNGFTQSCAEAARVARGPTFVLLDPSCRPAEGWLDELLGHVERFPSAGLVGAKLVGEDIRIDQAGQVVLSDGTVVDYGRGGDPDDPKYSFARRVDACSAAVAIRRSSLEAIGGFAAGLPLLGRETTDLALRLRQAGCDIWLQPVAACLHYGMRQNKEAAPDFQLAARWAAMIAHNGTLRSDIDQQADRAAGERLLVMDAAFPTQDRDAGSVVLMETLHLLRQLGFRIAFLTQDDRELVDDYAVALQRIGIECFHAPFVTDIQSALDFHGAFDVVFAFRYTVLEPAYAHLRRHLPQARIVFNNVDMHHLRAMREAEVTGRRSGRIAAFAAKAVELELIAKVDCTIVHTPVEAAMIRHDVGVDNCVEIPWIADVIGASAGFRTRSDILFLGNYLHIPNVDAACHFVEVLWPMLQPHLPQQARLVLAGASPPAAVVALAGPRVVVTGYVADLAPLFEAARVFVAPLRFGAGIKGKVIESLRRGVPSVMTGTAAEGMGLTDGVDAVIADDDAVFAAAVARLYADEAAWLRIQGSGYRFIQQNYSSTRGLSLVRKALDVADETWIARSERRLGRRLEQLRQDGPQVDAVTDRSYPRA